MTSKPPPNPMEKAVPDSIPAVSKHEIVFAGIRVDVYGLEEIPPRVRQVACLWLLHPRLSRKEHMKPIADATITEWNAHLRSGRAGALQGLIAVAFDQRNHGSRLVDALANEAWRQGNPRHAPDMYGTFQGTAVDVSQLLPLLPAYMFPHDEARIAEHMVFGVSLGGHAAWHCILHEPRIRTAVVVVGCADYARVMADRAAKSKLPSWTSSNPPGAQFFGSRDFSRSLMDLVETTDPAGLLMGEMDIVVQGSDYLHEPSEAEKRRLVPLMQRHLAGKKILNLAGGADKLVPYKCSEPFLRWLERAIRPGGWFGGNEMVLKDSVHDGVGHELTPAMLREGIAFLIEQSAIGGKDSKI